MRTSTIVAAALGGVVLAGVSLWSLCAKEYLSGKVWAEPPIVTPGDDGAPPSDAIVLFGGSDLSAWQGADKWIVADGAATITSNAQTRQSFGDCQLHIEWAAPEEVEGIGQQRGNSGVFLMGLYEIQILDSYDNLTYFDGQAGALYKQRPPLVNACRKPGEWQTYDIFFTAPRFAEGKLKTPGYVTVVHNGVLIQHHTEIEGATAWHLPAAYTPHAERLPLSLQYHRDPVRVRNIWIREL